MRNLKRMLALVMVGCLTFGYSGVKVQAADTTEVTSNTSSGAEVSLNVPSTFSVLIPKTIILEGNPGTATYRVGVKGDIDGKEQIQVIPASSMTLTNDVKPSITASVAQVRTAWAYDDISTSSYDYTSGTITSGDASAGKYVGTLMFTINLVDENGVIVGGSENVGVVENNLDPGIYDRYDVLLSSWEDSGINIEQNYTSSNYDTEATSANYALKNDSRFTTAKKIVIPDTVTKIGNYAFCNCQTLLNITLPSTLVSIGENAFMYCRNVQTFSIPEGCTSIGQSAFYDSGVASVVLPQSMSVIGVSVFSACSKLQVVTIPNVSTIAESAFSSCSALKNVTLGNGVITISANAFSRCTSLESIMIPDSVKTIRCTTSGGYSSSNGAFRDCTSLASVIYAGETYTSKSALDAAGSANGVSFPVEAFAGTAMLD